MRLVCVCGPILVSARRLIINQSYNMRIDSVRDLLFAKTSVNIGSSCWEIKAYLLL